MSWHDAFVGVMTAIMMFFLAVNSFQALLLMFAVPELWSHWQLADDEYFHALVGTEALPPISVVATLHNPEQNAAELAHMLLDLKYPRHEVVLVNDGTDGTLATLTSEFELYQVPPAFTVNLKTKPVRAYYRSRTHPRLLCIDKEAGGDGDAINAGLNAARYPHALAVGHDIIFEPDALLRLTRPFLLDRSVVAVGGTLRPANGSHLENGRLVPGPVRGWALGCQTIEYMRTFLFERLGWNRLASNLLFPGNTVLFKREYVFAVGGFDPNMSVPGIDLDIRLHRHLTEKGVNPRMPVIPDQIAWASVPEDMAGVARVRRSWQCGLWRSLRGTSSMFGNPEFGAFAMLAIPYFWIAVVIAPFVELVGYAGLVVGVATGALDSPFVVAYLAALVGYGILLSVWTVILQGLTFQRAARRQELARLLLFAVVESLGYRQLMMWYRVSAYFLDCPQPVRDNG